MFVKPLFGIVELTILNLYVGTNINTYSSNTYDNITYMLPSIPPECADLITSRDG